MATVIKTQMLTYSTTTGRWEVIVGNVSMSMSNATFLRYVNTYLEGCKFYSPTVRWQEAVERCRHLDYWRYAHYDSEILFENLSSQV